VRIVATFAATGEVLHCVNRASSSPATCLLTVRHRNRPGVLARVFDVLSDASINVEEMENTIFEGGKAAIARIQVTGTPSAADLARISSLEHVLHVALVSL
jgi:D-3-phosphoglycerate dehydrogenase